MRERLRDPLFWSGVTQLGKTVLAAVVSWVLATRVLKLEQSFLAPWAALLVVNTTVFRTLSQGTRQVGATVLGVLVASATGQLLGLGVVSVSVALAAGLAVGSIAWLKGEETTVAATALVVLATGFSDDDSVLVSRLLDTAVGIGVGVLVNMLVWPPLRRRAAIAALDAIDDAIGELLVDVADGIEAGASLENGEEWVERTRRLDGRLDEAWALVRQARESARLNPRRQARDVRDPKEWQDLLRRMEQAVAEIRSLARTLSHSVDDARGWEPDFRDGFVALTREAGRAIVEARHEPVLRVRQGLDDFIGTLSSRDLDPALWPEYGGVLTNLRNVVADMDEVAKANPLGRPPLPFGLGRHRA